VRRVEDAPKMGGHPPAWAGRRKRRVMHGVVRRLDDGVREGHRRLDLHGRLVATGRRGYSWRPNRARRRRRDRRRSLGERTRSYGSPRGRDRRRPQILPDRESTRFSLPRFALAIGLLLQVCLPLRLRELVFPRLQHLMGRRRGHPRAPRPERLHSQGSRRAVVVQHDVGRDELWR